LSAAKVEKHYINAVHFPFDVAGVRGDGAGAEVVKEYEEAQAVPVGSGVTSPCLRRDPGVEADQRRLTPWQHSNPLTRS